MDGPVEDIGSRSCVTRFVKTLLSIMEHGVKPHSKHLTEYFAFLFEFAKMGEEEVREDTLCFKSEEHTQTHTSRKSEFKNVQVVLAIERKQPQNFLVIK